MKSVKSVKAKLQSKLLTSSQDKQRLKNAVLTAIPALQTILDIAKGVAGATHVPGLQVGIGGLFLVLEIIKVTCFNAVHRGFSHTQTENLRKRTRCRKACRADQGLKRGF
jgi:hypothetical protein